jgi:hypothetical protein
MIPQYKFLSAISCSWWNLWGKASASAFSYAKGRKHFPVNPKLFLPTVACDATNNFTIPVGFYRTFEQSFVTHSSELGP